MSMRRPFSRYRRNAKLIAAEEVIKSRDNHIERLCKHSKGLTDERNRLAALLLKLEWKGSEEGTPSGCCPVCEVCSLVDHESECELGKMVDLYRQRKELGKFPEGIFKNLKPGESYKLGIRSKTVEGMDPGCNPKDSE